MKYSFDAVLCCIVGTYIYLSWVWQHERRTIGFSLKWHRMFYHIIGRYSENFFCVSLEKVKNYVNKNIIFYSDCRFVEIWDLSYSKINSRLFCDLKHEILYLLKRYYLIFKQEGLWRKILNYLHMVFFSFKAKVNNSSLIGLGYTQTLKPGKSMQKEFRINKVIF